MRFPVGTVYSDFNGFSAVAKLAQETSKLVWDSAELDFGRCKFFDANMSAPLYVVVTRLRDELNEVSIQNLPVQIEEILRKNCFLEVLNLRQMQDTNHTTLPFKIFKTHAVEQFYDYLKQYVPDKGASIMSKMLNKRFFQSILEVFSNAFVHSESVSGVFVCGQFFPKKHKLNFTIADAGVGIREKVRRFTGLRMSSCKAIEWALVEGHSTRNSQHPGGLGLKLIKDFINTNQGRLQIVSRFGFYEFSSKGQSVNKMPYDFPGTCVNIEINTHDQGSFSLVPALNGDSIF
ncbi:MAG: ATP-binding protein [Candidatus Cloacimonetes bacterium]|nr:ATP-binding protein [Candidatus Cloacimonadota bacterium]